MQKKPALLEAYARLLMTHGGGTEAEAILRKSLQKLWHEPLLDLYGKVEGRDPQRQLLEAEAWLKERPGSARLMLTVGRVVFAQPAVGPCPPIPGEQPAIAEVAGKPMASWRACSPASVSTSAVPSTTSRGC